jgi:hypothetical protein
MIAAVIVFGSAFVAFALMLLTVARVKGTCAGRCDEADGRLCDLCPAPEHEGELQGDRR